jgi:hypothetical protein
MIVKKIVHDENGLELRNWWERMRGKIDDDYFMKKTYDVRPWHEATLIPVEVEDKQFFGFVETLAHQDVYGVWRWALRVLQDEAYPPSQQCYAYLCAKAFIKSGKGNKNVFYTALRGLTYGLAKGQMVHAATGSQPRYREVRVNDPPHIGPPAMTAPPGETAPMDRVDCLGRFTTRQAVFEEFAQSLRHWIEMLEMDPKGKTRLKQVDLNHNEKSCGLCLHFSHPLPPEIFGDGTGLVTRAYSNLYNCFSDLDLKPYHSEDRKQLTLRFAHKPKTGLRMDLDHGASTTV